MDQSIQKIRRVYAEATKHYATSSVQFDRNRFERLLGSIYSPGPSYQLVLDFTTFTFDFVTESVQELLGENPNTYSPERVFERIHPDDRDHYAHCESIVGHFLFNFIDRKEIPYYKVSYQYRMRNKDDLYKLFLHQVIGIAVDDAGFLAKTFFNHSDISHITAVNNNAVSLIGLEGRPSYFNLKSIEDLSRTDDNDSPYSPREQEILRLLAEGLTSKEIGNYLHLSNDTVRTHRKNILIKGDCKNTAHAIATAVRNGYI